MSGFLDSPQILTSHFYYFYVAVELKHQSLGFEIYFSFLSVLSVWGQTCFSFMLLYGEVSLKLLRQSKKM